MQKSRFRIAGVATMATLALALSACGGSSDTNSSGSSNSTSGESIEVHPAGDYNEKSRDELKDGGELTLPLGELTEQQNLFNADMTSDTRAVWRWYNPSYALFDGEGNYTANPDFFTEVKDEVVDGNTVVTYTIRDEAKFNDDTPIDWTAFENTWKMNNGSNKENKTNSTDGYTQIKSVEKGESDKQAVVTFDGAYPWWQGLFNDLLHPAINTPDLYNNAYLNKLHPEYGAGPFKVDTVDFNAGTVTFVPNEKWWGDAPKLEKVTYRQMESQATINAFQAGEIDAASVASKNKMTIAKGMGDAIDIRAAMLPANYMLTLNSKAPALADAKVREAIMTAVDRSQLAAVRFNGLGYSEDLPGSLTLFSTQPNYTDNFGSVVSYDQAKAKSLLEEAGYTAGSDGIYEKDGQKLTVRYVSLGDSEMVKSMAAALQKMLKDAGINLQVEEHPSSDFSTIMSQADFDIIANGFRSSDPFGVAYFGQMYASDSELNKSGTGTPELDKQIKELQKLPTAEEQIKKANELEVEAFKTFGLMPYANGADMVGVKKGLANYGAYGFAVMPKEDIGWEK
ncbi:ABC transporter family substrate-binding protein [uncultured Corynebacterium sp.]|uniref:ABC transporter family substrate-binding protein n=1 Tax=uncultured Corynebacterium sp. TaxID=159447 RepID=UPI0025F75494|nr:ABC transporter family substrate-binding protein [uncultured Corynebacterium sp.]